MADETITTTGIAVHGASRLPSVEIDGFNIELRMTKDSWGDRPARELSGHSREVAEAAAQQHGFDPLPLTLFTQLQLYAMHRAWAGGGRATTRLMGAPSRLTSVIFKHGR